MAAEHQATLEQVIKLAGHGFADGVVPERFADHMRATGVETRSFIRPVEQIFGAGTGPDSWPETASLLAAMGTRASEEALRRLSLRPDQIDSLVVASVSGYTMPGIDVQIIRNLGLRPDVRRMPFSQIGCAAGLYGLIRALEQSIVYPGSKTLVVASEAFSTVMQPETKKLDALIYKALGGDGAAATVVTSTDEDRGQPAVELYDPFEYLIPETEHDYHLTSDPRGFLGFTSTTQAPQAILKARAALDEWRGDQPSGVIVAHHGGPAILKRTAEVLAASTSDLHHSWASLRELGNMGAVSVLEILRRTLESPETRVGPQAGVALTIGPGVTICAARLTFKAPTAAAAA